MKQTSGSRRRARQQREIPVWLVAAGAILVVGIVSWLLLGARGQGSGVPQPISQLSTADYHSLAFAPDEADTLFFGHHQGLLMSYDGGRTWQPTSLQNADAMALALPAGDPQILYAAGHNVFVKSTDGGASWEPVSTDLPGLDIHGFAADPDDSAHVYAHVVGFGLYGSEDGGEAWRLLSGDLPPSTFNLAVGVTPQTLYAAAGEAGLWRSDDGGQTWNRLSSTPGSGVLALAYNAASGQLFIGALGDGLYVSDDGGQTWESAGLSGTLVAIASHPQAPDHIAAIDEQGRVYASEDGGDTWLSE